MKKMITVLALALISNVTLASNGSVCKSFGDTTDAIESAPGYTLLKKIEKTEKYKAPSLTKEEEFVVHSVAMNTKSESLSLKEALQEFFGLDDFRDYAAGSVEYFQITGEEGKPVEFVMARYYPGDNEYGAIFRVLRNKEGRIAFIHEIAGIGDGDISCR